MIIQKNLTIIISTWNNSKRLAITLNAIAECKIPKKLTWEIVVINNNCTDDTDQAVASFADRLPILYVKEPQQGVSRAKNSGLKVATGEWILFTDDDVKPCKEWVTIYWPAIQKFPEGYYFGGPIESEYESIKPSVELMKFAPCSVKGLDWGNSERILSDKEFFLGANWACQREILLQLGGFDMTKGLNSVPNQVRTGEETDLINRLKRKGFRAFYLPEAKISHFVPSHKCSLSHIANRYEAAAYESVLNESNSHKWVMWFDIPRWLYRDLVISWLKWIISHLAIDKNYKQYMNYRFYLGQFRAMGGG